MGDRVSRLLRRGSVFEREEWSGVAGCVDLFIPPPGRSEDEKETESPMLKVGRQDRDVSEGWIGLWVSRNGDITAQDKQAI